MFSGIYKMFNKLFGYDDTEEKNIISHFNPMELDCITDANTKYEEGAILFPGTAYEIKANAWLFITIDIAVKSAFKYLEERNQNERVSNETALKWLNAYLKNTDIFKYVPKKFMDMMTEVIIKKFNKSDIIANLAVIYLANYGILHVHVNKIDKNIRTRLDKERYLCYLAFKYYSDIINSMLYKDRSNSTANLETYIEHRTQIFNKNFNDVLYMNLNKRPRPSYNSDDNPRFRKRRRYE